VTTVTPQLVVRIALVGVLTVIFQVSAVSQITIFGVNADLSPLVIASVGLLAGSLPGAVMGFGVGLFLDLALVQTVGLSSLLYLTVGYGAGRLRELRDPQGAVVPIAVGAAATAVSTIGFSLMQFLLTIIVNAIIAGPVYALVRRVLTPALPDDPRRRRRRAYTTGGLSPLSRA